MHLEIIRDTVRADAILGTLTLGSLVLQTLELPWLPIDGALCGHPDESCVPAGEYQLIRHDTPAHPKTFALSAPALGIYPGSIPDGCAGRNACLIHNGNYARDSLGCILLGRARAFAAGGLSMITSSDVSLAAFKTLVPWVDGHTLTIAESFT